MRNTFLHLFLCFIFSCSPKEQDNGKQINLNEHIQHKTDTVATFVDSTDIADSKSSKILLASIVTDDSITKSYISFYNRENNSWKLKYSFADEHWGPSDVLLPVIADYNNDGYKDFKYSKGTGARGGNSINNLFIYDEKGDSLAYVLNSNDYPNLHYNKETNSINSYILTGGVETFFMRLDSNTLTPFASIYQNGKEVTVTEYDDKGTSTVIFTDSSGKYEELARFINFKPLKVEQ